MEGLFFLYPFILFILPYCPAFEVMQGKEQDFRNGRIIFSLSFHSVYPALSLPYSALFV